MDFAQYNHLGFHNPFYVNEDNKYKLQPTFAKILEEFKGDRVLDVSSVIEIARKGYALGDNTIIKGVYKTPWMAKLGKDENSWDYYDLPPHQELREEEGQVADNLFELLKAELISYIGSSNRVGLLLTGGMDSRIVACVLKEIQQERNTINPLKVIAYTWGLDESRDVQYASRIADFLNWQWVHLKVDTEQILKNLEVSINEGSQFSPVHYHAMLQLIDRKDEVSCYIAGSFGDSIGRAEYSGTKVVNLKPLLNRINPFGLINKNLIQKYYADSEAEIQRYHNLFPQEKQYQQFELDYQLHYMRRMLNSCMGYVHNFVPIYQMFSAPSVYGYMWSLSPEIRSDNIYKIILTKFQSGLLNIPWARTGLLYGQKNGKPDSLLKASHKYGKLLRTEILPKYKNIILNNKLGIFNKTALKTIYSLCTNLGIENNYNYEVNLLWIISLINTCDKFNVNIEVNKNEQLETKMYFRGIGKYVAKYILR